MAEKRPTRKQKELLTRKNLNWRNWLVAKNLPGELHVISRYSNQRRVILYPGLATLASQKGKTG